MDEVLEIDVEKLRADMAAHVERTSARKFSLAATGGKNPDFYRNFVNNGQDKRLSAKVFMGIVSALGRNPFDYVIGVEPRMDLPSVPVLTSTFAVLLDSLGIAPFEDERAQKLASRFPDALRSIAALQAQTGSAEAQPPGEVSPAGDEARRPV